MPVAAIKNRVCDECGATGAKLRCTKCKACFYCSEKCQKRNWKRIHKRVCSTDPSMRRFIRVEMAVERSLEKESTDEAPNDATCYICREGEAEGKLMRGCACRGASAGFVHLKCLTELAVSKEVPEGNPSDSQAHAWTKCVNCKQQLTGTLAIEMQRRLWRRYRSDSHPVMAYFAMRSLATSLGGRGEADAATHLFDEGLKLMDNDLTRLDMKRHRFTMLKKDGQKLEALELLHEILPEAKVCCEPERYAESLWNIAEVLLDLDRIQEAHERAAETVAFSEAKFRMDYSGTLQAKKTYAITCAKLGRIDESKALFEAILKTETRIYGSDHQFTKTTRDGMATALPDEQLTP